MDRLRVWIESIPASMKEEDRYGMALGADGDARLFRPPPLRTANTYDDEDAFNNVSLNLLSRFEALDLSASETIKATIVSQRERISFHEALCIRRCRSVHVSPSNASLVDRVDKAFGSELLKMSREETSGEETRSWGKRDCPPTSPRAIQNSTSSGSESRDKTRRTRFFPDSDSKGGGFFRSRRLQNIDWKLAEAVTQVKSLCLDGSQAPPQCEDSTYQPPSPVSRVIAE